MKYLKTEAGLAAFRERSPQLNSRQRSAFLLFDGTKTARQVLAATVGLGIVEEDITYLLGLGFLAAEPESAPAQAAVPVSDQAALSVPDPAPASAPALTHAQLYARAWPVATRLTAALGLRGFRLNMAVEGAAGYDDLLALLPKIADAVGPAKVVELVDALGVAY